MLLFAIVIPCCICLAVMLMDCVGKRKRDAKTDREGEQCFAFVHTVEILSTSVVQNSTGTFIKAYVATIAVYVPSIKKVTNVLETIGYDKPKYNEGDFLRVNYLLGDVNIKEKIVDKETIPEDVRNALLGISAGTGGDVRNVDTQDWIVTEEAYADTTQFEHSINAEYREEDNPENREITKHYSDEAARKLVRRRTYVLLADYLLFIAALALLISSIK